jgi:hypothetical protein
VSLKTLSQNRELGCLLLAFLAFAQVVLYIHERPFAACRAESWVLHLEDGFVVSGVEEIYWNIVIGERTKTLGVCAWEPAASTNQMSLLS